MPLARAKLGVDSTELPDATLNNQILVDYVEKRTKSAMPNWSDFVGSDLSTMKLAAICFMAAQFTDYCETVVLSLEYEGNYRSERQKIDWQGKKVDLIGEGLSLLHGLDPTVTLYPNPVAIISPATPLYQS